VSARNAALLILVAASATIAGAWVYESLGYIPCELCLMGRIPYYAGIPIAALTALAAHKGGAGLARAGFFALALLFAAGAALALYHSGVEWKLFPGPSDCTGTLARAASTEEFLRQLRTVKPVRCDEPSLFVLGLTLANWNAVISAGLAAVAGFGARLHDGRRRARARQ
jgi:disulfide bond formation protein DsbB